MSRKKISSGVAQDLQEEYTAQQSDTEETEGSKKSKKPKEPKYLPVGLPIAGFDEDDEDNYEDAFTVGMLKLLRRMALEEGFTAHSEPYVYNDGTWYLLAYDYDQYNNVVLDRHYVKSNRALKDAIKTVAKPLVKTIHKCLKDLSAVCPDQVKALLNGLFPLKFFRENAFKLLHNGSQYIIPAIEFESLLLNYVCKKLLDDIVSPVEEILYITNDEDQKENARYYYNLNPSKDHFDEAPRLADYSKKWFDFLHGRFNNERMDLLRFTHHVYGMISAKCHSRQALAILDTGNTGKSVLKDALAAILPGAVQTGITLSSLCGRFLPSKINGCRGLIIDEGESLQAFFDGDFFKSVTGATDDNGMQIADRKMKEMIMMRVGSMRFMFLANSKLRIKNKAGLTRISPMFFKCNFGRLAINGDIVEELAAEGDEFIQFCIDNETYYKNITSKYNHWYCPLIEDNGNVNVLTDEQFDAWYNETSKELYFSEEDQHDPDMRKRLERISMENCIKVTTDPDTGDVMVYGSLGNELATETLQNLMEELFVKDDNAYVGLSKLAEFVRDQLNDPKLKYGKALKELGFITGSTAANIMNNNPWRHLKNGIEKKFGVTTKRRKGKLALCGIRCLALPMDEVPENTDEDFDA